MNKRLLLPLLSAFFAAAPAFAAPTIGEKVFPDNIDALMEPPFSPEVNERAMALLSEIENALLTPHKEGDQPWLPPDSGLSKTG